MTKKKTEEEKAEAKVLKKTQKETTALKQRRVRRVMM
jgi:hypothetical protein